MRSFLLKKLALALLPYLIPYIEKELEKRFNRDSLIPRFEDFLRERLAERDNKIN